MELSRLDLNNNFLPPEHSDSVTSCRTLTRSYEEIFESELKRVSPVLKGHSDGVCSLALTSDNSSLISCGLDNTIRVWSLIDRVEEQKHEIQVGTNENLSKMALSADNKFVVLIVSNKYLLVWNLKTRTQVLKIPECEGVSMHLVSIASDSLHFCTADSGRTVKVYDLTGKVLKSLQIEEFDLTFLLFTDRVVIFGDSSGKISVWNTLNPNIDFVLDHNSAKPLCGVSYQNNTFLAAGYATGDVVIWDLAQKEEKCTIPVENQEISSISYSSSSSKQTIVCGTNDKMIAFIDLVQGTVEGQFNRHSDAINDVVQTSDGKLVITASNEKLIKIYQNGEYRERKTQFKYGNAIYDIALHPGSDLLAVSYASGDVKLFKQTENIEKISISNKGQAVSQAIWSHDRSEVITANQVPEISVFSFETKTFLFSFPCEVQIKSLALSLDSKTLYGCGETSKIFAWDYSKKNLDYVLESKGNNNVVVFASDPSRLFAGAEDGVNVWNLESKAIERVLGSGDCAVICLFSLTSRNLLVSGDINGNLSFWNLADHSREAVIDEGKSKAIAMDLMSDGKSLVVIHDTHKVSVINTETLKAEQEFDTPESNYSCKALDENVILIGDSRFVRFWNLSTRKEESSISAHWNWINSILIESQKDTFITFSADRGIKSWKISDKSLQQSLQIYNPGNSALCLTDEYFGICIDFGGVLIYSTRSFKLVTEFKVHDSSINWIDCYEKLFATAGNDYKVAVFDLETRKVSYFEHTDSVKQVKISRDARLIFSASDDGLIKVWNVESKTLLYTLTHQSMISSFLTFSSEKHLISCTMSKTLKLWNLLLQKEEFSLDTQSAYSSLALNQDESLLFCGCSDSSIIVYDVKTRKIICSLKGHSSLVQRVIVNDDILFSSSQEGVKTWLIKENKELFSFRWKKNCPRQLLLSPNEKYLAASLNDGAVQIYDFRREKFLEIFYPLESELSNIAFTADSESLVIVGQDSSIKIWNIKAKKLQKIPKTKKSYTSLTFSTDYSLLATCTDSQLLIWDWDSQKIVNDLGKLSTIVHNMKFSQDNKILFASSEDGTIFKCNLESKEISSIKNHTFYIGGFAISNTRKMMIAGSYDRRVSFYDLENNKLIKCEEKHSDYVRGLVISGDEKFVVSTGDDKVLIVWDLETQQETFRLSGHSHYIMCIAISNDNDHVYTGSMDFSIMKWSLNQKKSLKYVRTTSGNIYCIALAKNGTRAYTGSDANTINVFDIPSRTEIICLPGHTQYILGLALSDDDSLLVSGSDDKTVRVFDTNSFEELVVFKDGHSDGITAVSITNDKKYIASCSLDTLIIIWNLLTKDKEFIFEGHKKSIYFHQLTYDSKYLLSASEDETIKLWSMESRALVHTFTGHNNSVKSLVIFKNKPSFVSGGDDGVIKVWLIQENREEFSLQGHSASISTLQLTSDELRLISGSFDFKIIIWDLKQRKVELCLSNCNSSIYDLKMVENGNFLFSASEDCSLRVWKMNEPAILKDQTYSLKPYSQVVTSDGKFQIDYLYGSVSEVNMKNSLFTKLPLGINDVLDPYYQNLLSFYNLIDSICEDDYNHLMPETVNIVFSRYLYSALHILALKGNSKKIEELIMNSNSLLKTDYFGKSPIFYSLNKGHQNCTVVLIDFLIKMSSSNDKTKIHSSLASISEELPLIIKNSSKYLHLLLDSCLLSTDPTFISVSQNLPVYHFNKNFLPITLEFNQRKSSSQEAFQVIMKYTAFPLPWKIGSEDCIELLDSIINCNNTNIYSTDFIKYYLQIQWNQLLYWVFGYTILLWINMVLLVLLFTYDDITETWILPVYLLLNFILMVWESIQMYKEGLLKYFSDPWNILDFCRFTISMVWVNFSIFGNKTEVEYRILTWIVTLLNFTRGVTGFRLFDGTRYYVRLILRALGDMGYFIIMLSYSTLTFGILFQVSRKNEPLDFKTLWMDSYSLNFGNFEAQDGYKFSFETLAYMLATVINVILMLNLLISILGDSYSNFQTEKELIDYSEKASIIMEIHKMQFWVTASFEKKYLHALCSSTTDEDEGDINEKIQGIKTGLEDIQKFVKSTVDSSKDEITIQIQRIDTKIQLFEDKMLGFEGKFNDLNQSINKIIEFVKPKPEENKKPEEIH